MSDQSMSAEAAEELRRSALAHLWTHNGAWNEMAEEGLPFIAVHGKGVRIVDSLGREWMDVSAGYQCVTAGHGRTELAQVAYDQMSQLAYFPNSGATPPSIKLAEKLAQITPGNLSRSFFVNGGSDAVETAVKLARAYHKRNGEAGRYRIISRKGSYHGALGLTTWLGGRDVNEQRDYIPAYPGMLYAPQPNPYRCEYGGQSPSECAELCVNAIEDLILFHGPETVAAVVADPIPGNAAVPGPEYWPRLREICTNYGVVLIADEVITAWGRTGKMFALEHWGVVPDIMTVAKGLSSAYAPVGAVIATDDIASVFAGGEQHRPFIHALTFGGHPVTTAVALRNIEIIEREKLPENAAVQGRYLVDRLAEMQEKYAVIGHVHAMGLQIGLELVKDRNTKEPIAPEFRDMLSSEMEKRRLLVRAGTAGFTLYPPISISSDETQELAMKLDESFAAVSATFGLN